MARVTAEVGNAASSYEILAKLAMGGMAEIFLARGASVAGVERYVVLKRILRHRANDHEFIRMFLDEARLAAQLQHPNIAQVYDIGKLGDSYFFTMEYVHGETVRTLLQRSHALRRPLPFGIVLSIIAGAASGLHHAHDRKGMDGKPLGIVHRDVSPSNLMVSYEGTVKVVDFGVAKAAHRDHETRSGTVKGKISYMSPEQCKGLELDRRSDVFALGIVMWEMLTTERLFRRNSDFENMQAIVAEEPLPPSSLRPEVPPELDEVVLRCLAKSPDARYQSADELHEALETVAARLGSTLSAASLGRFMRELFGQRPEPWIELQSSESHPEVFTVTSDPLVSPDLAALRAGDALDVRLAAVPELPRPHHTPTATPMTTTQAPPPRLVSIASNPAAPTLALSVEPPEALPPTAPIMPRPHTPSMTPPSHSGYPVLSASQSQSLIGYAPNAPYAPPEPPKRSRPVLWLAPALAVGVGLGIALAVGGKHDEHKAAPAVAVVPADAAGVAVEEPAPTPPAPTPPAPTPPAPTPVVETPAPVETPPAPVEHTEPTPPTATPKTPTPKTPKAPDTIDMSGDSPPKAPDVAALYRAGKWSEVVAQCSTSAKVVDANATACTVSACRTKDTAKAKQWVRDVSAAKRAAVVKLCDGVLPADKPDAPKTDCKANPLDCYK